jgi:hydrogenase-4 component B
MPRWVGGLSAGMPSGAIAMQSGTSGVAFDHVVPLALMAALLGGFATAVWITMRSRGSVVRPVPTWGCGGELTARTEYTATAFSKPLMMIFEAIYRPTRRVEARADVSPYFPQEVRYKSEIEPTFERYVYAPLVRGVMWLATGMEVLQAGSLHAYLAYVIALVVSLVLFVWWRG